MEILFSIDNFEEENGKYREINSPRSLEACLRSGYDPSELYPRAPSYFKSKQLTEEMLQIKFEAFEKKRQDKIDNVKMERTSIIKYTEKKRFQATAGTLSPSQGSPNVIAAGTNFGNTQFTENSEEDDAAAAAAAKSSAMLEMEERRIEALRRRQEKELNKIVEREQTLASLQLKIKRAEEEDMKKKKLHEKKVAEEHAAAEKKKAMRAQEQKKKEHEEEHKKRELLRKEAAVAEKLAKKRLEMEAEMMKEARMRDEERKKKIEESRKKTEALLKLQEDAAEQNRLKMMEREQRIVEQLEQKKEQKRMEVAAQREKATKRIMEALQKHHHLHEAKKNEFNRKQAEAEVRAQEVAIAEREKLKKQAEERDKRNKVRTSRLIDAFKTRTEHRRSIIERRQEKDAVYAKIKEEQDYQIAMMKFTSDLKLKDKLENVERVARMNEFKRLQTMQKISEMDQRYEDIQAKKEEMLRKHMDEAKMSLTRKHEISDAMERMRMTNDFTLLDKLFANTNKKGKASTMRGGGGRADGEADNNIGGGGDIDRLNQTM